MSEKRSLNCGAAPAVAIAIYLWQPKSVIEVGPLLCRLTTGCYVVLKRPAQTS